MATLINVATPGPALALDAGLQSYTPGSVNSTLWTGGAVNLTVAGQGYQADKQTLAAGTWVVTGIVWAINGASPFPNAGYLNLASNVAANSWTVANQGAGGTGTPLVVTAVITLTGPTTIYLNITAAGTLGLGAGTLYATRIA